MVAELSSKFGDGKLYCISYESMQRDIAGQMDLRGQCLGDDIDAESLEILRKNAGKTSCKRGGDDLHEYLANYDEVRESLAECLHLQEVWLQSTLHLFICLCCMAIDDGVYAFLSSCYFEEVKVNRFGLHVDN